MEAALRAVHHRKNVAAEDTPRFQEESSRGTVLHLSAEFAPDLYEVTMALAALGPARVAIVLKATTRERKVHLVGREAQHAAVPCSHLNGTRLVRHSSSGLSRCDVLSRIANESPVSQREHPHSQHLVVATGLNTLLAPGSRKMGTHDS
jgi:hypothetical protein